MAIFEFDAAASVFAIESMNDVQTGVQTGPSLLYTHTMPMIRQPHTNIHTSKLRARSLSYLQTAGLVTESLKWVPKSMEPLCFWEAGD